MTESSEPESRRVEILRTARFDRLLSKLSDDQHDQVIEALERLIDAFGGPHTHSGLSVRKLRRDLFEARAGLELRLLFLVSGRRLVLVFLGDHDEVRAFLRSFR